MLSVTPVPRVGVVNIIFNGESYHFAFTSFKLTKSLQASVRHKRILLGLVGRMCIAKLLAECVCVWVGGSEGKT